MRVNDGEIGYSSLAAKSMHVTASVAKHGGSFSLNAEYTKYLSARLTAK